MSHLAANEIIWRFVKKHERYPEKTDFMELRQLFYSAFEHPIYTPIRSDFQRTMLEISVRIANNKPFEKITVDEILCEFGRRSSERVGGIFDLIIDVILDVEHLEIDVRDRFTDFAVRRKFEHPPNRCPQRPIDMIVDSIFEFYQSYQSRRQMSLTCHTYVNEHHIANGETYLTKRVPIKEESL